MIFSNSQKTRCIWCGNLPPSFKRVNEGEGNAVDVCTECAGIQCFSTDGKLRHLTPAEIATIKGSQQHREWVESTHEEIVREKGLWG